MDNICHTLAGLALAEAGLKQRTRLGVATLLLGANLPDVDALAYFRDPLFALSFRRGWTHGVLAMAVLPPLLALAVLGWDRVVRRSRPSLPPARPREILLLAALAVVSHPLLDLLNTYGVRLLMPFSGRWFYGDALFIVDPWLWIIFVGGVVLALRHEGAGRRDATRPARVALGVAGLYILAMVGSGIAARRIVRAEAAAEGVSFARQMAGPVPLDPTRRDVVLDLAGGYRTGSFTWLRVPHLSLGDSIPTGFDSPAARAAAATPAGALFLRWSRFPAATVEPRGSGPLVLLRDLRYARAAGPSWAAVQIAVPDGGGGERPAGIPEPQDQRANGGRGGGLLACPEPLPPFARWSYQQRRSAGLTPRPPPPAPPPPARPPAWPGGRTAAAADRSRCRSPA
jgi:inner membrane protein